MLQIPFVYRIYYGEPLHTSPENALPAERQAAARDRRVLADHDAKVCNSTRGLGTGQRHRKPGPVGQFPAPGGNGHALLVGA